MKLYPHQEIFMDKIRKAMRSHKRIFMQAPTGYGKSTLISYMFKSIFEKGKIAWFVIHRVELREQVEEILKKADVPYGLIIAGEDYDPTKNIQICMVQSLKNRIKFMKTPDLVFFDEAHLSCSPTYKKVLEFIPNTFIIGGSATPRRTDRRPLKEMYETLICSEDVRWLIDNNFLSKYKLYRPSNINLSGVHIKRGDYDQVELAETLDKSSIMGDSLEHYISLARGKKFLIFDYSVKASKRSAELFTAAGFPCVHVDADTPKKERRDALARFRGGELVGLSNYALFCEGVDIPDIECVILKRPTKSIIVYRQSVGRGMRKTRDDKVLIILDHASASVENGFPDEPIEWSLEGKTKKSERILTSKTCPGCFEALLHIPTCKDCGWAFCPGCGHLFAKIERKMKFVEGTLQEVDTTIPRLQKPNYPVHWFKNAFTLEDHKKVAEQHGKKPGWGWYVWKDRKKRKAI